MYSQAKVIGSMPETENLPKPMRVEEESHCCHRTAARAKEEEIKA
jgi:hypothetical protein